MKVGAMDAVPPVPLQRLQQAMNAHDLDALTSCFASDYRNETPLHPAQNFVGSAQVRQNWTRILASVPDLSATLVRWAEGPPGTCWAEWDWRGTRADGAPLHLAGVTVLGMDGSAGGAFAWSRFYLEPVEERGVAVDAAVRTTVGGGR
jgi:ketosteroid isomerase-like protein